MAFNTNWGSPINIATRPLNKGIYQDRPSNMIEPGAMWDIENFRVNDYSLKRRGGFKPILEDIGITEPIVDVFTVNNRGTRETLVLTEERLFNLNNNIATEKVIDVTDATVTWALDAQGRFEATVQASTIDELRAGVEVKEGSNIIGNILSFSGNVITISNPGGLTSVVGFGDFNSYNRWLGFKGWHASHTYLPGTYDKVIITAYAGTGLYSYDSASGLEKFNLQGLDTSPTDIKHAKAITHFANRLWLGNVTVGSSTYNRRIYWSELGQYETFDPLAFVDLPDSEGDLVTMKSLGNLLVLYFTDSIYIGRPTQLFGLPYAFERFEASDLGLISNKAIISWLDGHFLVLNDDIYYFTNSLALQPIGSQVKDITVKACSEVNLMRDVFVAPDVENNDILFLFPLKEDGSADSAHGSSDVLWRYHYRTQAWSKDKVSVDAGGLPYFYFTGIFSSYFYTLDKSWEDWWNEGGYSPEDLTAGGLPYPTDGEVAWDGGDNQNWSEDFKYWLDLANDADQNKRLFYGISRNTSQGLYIEGVDGIDEIYSGTYNISELLEASDTDYNAPDTDKTITRCSFKLRDYSDENFSLQFYTSNNRGRTWRLKGLLRIRTDEDEGRVDLLSTGSNFRFKLIGTNNVERQPYDLMEYVLRIAGRGLQTDDI